MMTLMLALAIPGLIMLLTGHLIARLVVRAGDPIALTRMLQLVGILLLVAALLARPRNPQTAAFPPAPDAAETRNR